MATYEVRGYLVEGSQKATFSVKVQADREDTAIRLAEAQASQHRVYGHRMFQLESIRKIGG